MKRSRFRKTSTNVRDGALKRQNRVLIWIDGHISSRVLEFFLTDWIQGNAIPGPFRNT